MYHLPKTSELKRVWHFGALSQILIARLLARANTVDYYQARKVTLWVLYYDMAKWILELGRYMVPPLCETTYTYKQCHKAENATFSSPLFHRVNYEDLLVLYIIAPHQPAT